MNSEEFLDWLLSLTEGIPGFGESIIELLGLNKTSKFLEITQTLFDSLIKIFIELGDLITYGLMIFMLLISNFHIFIILIEIFFIGLSCMKSTEPITILSTFFHCNYKLIELIIIIVVGIYKLLGVILYNVIKLIPTK